MVTTTVGILKALMYPSRNITRTLEHRPSSHDGDEFASYVDVLLRGVFTCVSADGATVDKASFFFRGHVDLSCDYGGRPVSLHDRRNRCNCVIEHVEIWYAAVRSRSRP